MKTWDSPNMKRTFSTRKFFTDWYKYEVEKMKVLLREIAIF